MSSRVEAKLGRLTLYGSTRPTIANKREEGKEGEEYEYTVGERGERGEAGATGGDASTYRVEPPVIGQPRTIDLFEFHPGHLLSLSPSCTQ